MAVTRIWSIKGRAGAPLDYVANPEKTQREFTEAEMQALQDVIAYKPPSNRLAVVSIRTCYNSF